MGVRVVPIMPLVHVPTCLLSADEDFQEEQRAFAADAGQTTLRNKVSPVLAQLDVTDVLDELHSHLEG